MRAINSPYTLGNEPFQNPGTLTATAAKGGIGLINRAYATLSRALRDMFGDDFEVEDVCPKGLISGRGLQPQTTVFDFVVIVDNPRPIPAAVYVFFIQGQCGPNPIQGVDFVWTITGKLLPPQNRPLTVHIDDMTDLFSQFGLTV